MWRSLQSVFFSYRSASSQSATSSISNSSPRQYGVTSEALDRDGTQLQALVKTETVPVATVSDTMGERRGGKPSKDKGKPGGKDAQKDKSAKENQVKDGSKSAAENGKVSSLSAAVNVSDVAVGQVCRIEDSPFRIMKVGGYTLLMDFNSFLKYKSRFNKIKF